MIFKNKYLFLIITAIFLISCRSGAIYEVPNHGKIFLSGTDLYDNSKPPFNHPYKISEKTVAAMMADLKCNEAPVFSDNEIKEFAKEISKAFRKADANSFVSFYISENAIKSISGGEIYIKGDRCYWYFYPTSEIYMRSPVIDERLECLGNKIFTFDVPLLDK